MSPELKAYLADIGRRGGLKSRRVLDPQTARQMVRLREARKAFARFRLRCFWSAPATFLVSAQDIPWVARQLRNHGGQEGWRIAGRLCP